MGAQVRNRVTAAYLRLVKIILRAAKVSLEVIIGDYNNIVGLILVLDHYVNKSSIHDVKVKLDMFRTWNTTTY
jgi:hypothetical protein